MPKLTNARLHEAARHSLRLHRPAMRAYLEGGSAERLLTDLLFIELHRSGYEVTREGAFDESNRRRAADLVVHGADDLFIEAKQRHLKDGARFAFPHFEADLRRHGKNRSLGIIYIIDERESKTKYKSHPFQKRNRTTKHGVPTVLKALKDRFGLVYPRQQGRALLRTFRGQGKTDLYAFIVESKTRRRRAS